MPSKQQSLFKDKTQKKRYSRVFYGGLTKGAKLERPLSTKKWIHLVLKSEKAKGQLSLLHSRHKFAVEKLIQSKARKFHVHIADMVNMGNHLHFKIRIAGRSGFQKFLKAITNGIARLVTGARRGKPFGRFWQGLAYTRVLRSSFEELGLKGYFTANRVELEKGSEAREFQLDKFNRWLYRLRYKTVTPESFIPP